MLLAEMTNKTIKMRQCLHIKYKETTSKPKKFFEKKVLTYKANIYRIVKSWSWELIKASKVELGRSKEPLALDLILKELFQRLSALSWGFRDSPRRHQSSNHILLFKRYAASGMTLSPGSWVRDYRVTLNHHT